MRIPRLLTAFFIMLMPLFALAEGSAGVAGAAFLDFGIGSRRLGAGEATTAYTEDLNGLYANPAILGTLRYPELSVFHNELIEDSRLENVTAAFKLAGGYLGVGNTLFWVPPFDRINIDGEKTGEVYFLNSATNVGYGRDFGYLYAGANIKIIYERIDTKSYAAAAADFGLLKGFRMYTPFSAPSRNFFMGLSVQNVGSQIAEAPLPRKINMGISFLPVDWLRFSTDVSESAVEYSDLYDFTYGFYESFQVRSGLELNYMNLIFFRTGYRFNDVGTYTMGVGVNYAIRNVSFSVDASVADNGVFGHTYSLNFMLKLIPKVVTVDDIAVANEYYKKGLKEYVTDDIDAALDSFEKTREYNPYHKNIDKKIDDLENLRKLKKRTEELEQENQY